MQANKEGIRRATAKVRKRILGTLTSKMKEIETMGSDDQNVKDMMENDFV